MSASPFGTSRESTAKRAEVHPLKDDIGLPTLQSDLDFGRVFTEIARYKLLQRKLSFCLFHSSATIHIHSRKGVMDIVDIVLIVCQQIPERLSLVQGFPLSSALLPVALQE